LILLFLPYYTQFVYTYLHISIMPYRSQYLYYGIWCIHTQMNLINNDKIIKKSFECHNNRNTKKGGDSELQ
jgi:hypothetical protein